MPEDANYWNRVIRRRVGRRPVLRAAAGTGALAAGGVVLACTSKNAGTTSGSSSGRPLGTPALGATQAAANPGASPAARRGGTFRISGQISGDPPSMDYFVQGSSTNGTMWNVACSKLVQWDELPDRGSTPVENVLPDLATSWETPDPLTYIFHMRHGVKAPTGRETTADDVKWSLERSANAGTGGGVSTEIPEAFNGKEPNVELPDQYTLRFHLASPDADFLPTMGDHTWEVQFKDVIPGTDSGWGQVTKVDQIRGTGPFQPTEYVPSSQITFQRNQNYYDSSLPYVDTIQHPLIADPTAAAAALQAGQLDAYGPLTAVPINLALDLAKQPNLVVEWNPGMNWWPWIFDVERPPFNDVRVRQALALAVDRKKWIQTLYFGRGRDTVLVEPYPQFWVLDPAKMGDDGKYYTTYDPKTAKQLLAAAGFANGFSYDLQMANISSYTVSQPMADLMQSMVNDVGLKQNAKIVDYATHLQGPIPTAGIYQSWIVRPNIQSFVYTQVHYKQAKLGGKPIYSDDFYNRDTEYQQAVTLMEKQRATLDINERQKVVFDLERIWARNIWQFYYSVPDTPVVYNKKVHNFNPASGWNAGVWKYVWLES